MQNALASLFITAKRNSYDLVNTMNKSVVYVLHCKVKWGKATQ
jgi:hypothetical protein